MACVDHRSSDRYGRGCEERSKGLGVYEFTTYCIYGHGYKCALGTETIHPLPNLKIMTQVILHRRVCSSSAGSVGRVRGYAVPPLHS